MVVNRTTPYRSTTREYEGKYRKIPKGAIVVMNSRWGQRYPNAELMYGSSKTGITDGDILTFNYPGFSLKACEFLLSKRQVSYYWRRHSVHRSRPEYGSYPLLLGLSGLSPARRDAHLVLRRQSRHRSG